MNINGEFADIQTTTGKMVMQFFAALYLIFFHCYLSTLLTLAKC